MIDSFVASLGIVDSPEFSKESLDFMVERAQEFLTVGRLSLEDWNSMGPNSRAAFLVASERLEAEKLARMAKARGSAPELVAEALSPADGGTAISEVLLVRAVDEASKSIEARR